MFGVFERMSNNNVTFLELVYFEEKIFHCEEAIKCKCKSNLFHRWLFLDNRAASAVTSLQIKHEKKKKSLPSLWNVTGFQAEPFVFLTV